MQFILKMQWPEPYGMETYFMSAGAVATIALHRAKRFSTVQEAAEYAVKVEPSVCWLVAYETGELVICRSRHTDCDSIADALETGFDWWANSDATEFAIERNGGRVVLVTEHPLPPRGMTPKTPNWENTPEAWLATFDRVIAAIHND